MDQVLRPYLQATEESETEQRLEELLLFHAAPEIRFTLRQRLGFHVSQQGVNPHNHDAEDLYQEIITKTVEVLRALISADSSPSSPRSEIENFKQYVGRIATNVCTNFIRGKSPARWRLKNNLRDVLNRQPEFALWKVGTETLGGLAAWKGTTSTSSWPPQSQTLEEELQRFRATRLPSENLKQVSLKRIVAELFGWVEHPLGLETLLGCVAILLEIRDVPVESLDDKTSPWIEARVADSTVSASSRVEEQDLLRQLWEIVRTLPANQRDAYCFRFENASGQDLFSLLIAAEIVTLSQLSQEFARPVEEIRRLMSQMPMDSATAGAEMDSTSTQVNKWRFYAMERLEKVLLPFARK